MRGFYLARLMRDESPVVRKDGVECLAYPEAKLPVYKTRNSAGADFFCAEEVVIPSIWKSAFKLMLNWVARKINGECSFEEDESQKKDSFAPTRVHTGIKASMYKDEVLKLYNRSSNPRKVGLILANGVGVIDADFFENKDNDGEIGFEFYNILPWDVKLKVGDTLGQGVFEKFLYPEEGLIVQDVERKGGYGSTDEK